MCLAEGHNRVPEWGSNSGLIDLEYDALPPGPQAPLQWNFEVSVLTISEKKP